MTKEELKRYTNTKMELKQIKQQIEKLQHDKYNFKALSYSDMPKGSSENDKITAVLVRIESKVEDYYNKYNELLEELDKIETVINSLQGIERIIMRYRYIEDLKWEKICTLTNYSSRQIHYIHEKILEKIA